MSAIEDNPPASTLFSQVSLEVQRSASQELTMRNRLELGHYPESLIQILRHWASERPAAVFLEERRAGGWIQRTYGEMSRRTALLGAKILRLGCSTDRPIMILSPNSIAHAEVALAAMRVGVPVCPVSVAYAAPSSDFARLRHVAKVATPAVLFIGEGEQFRAPAEAVTDLVGITLAQGDWDSVPSASDKWVSEAESGVQADTVAKLLFTSGSTDKPKAVPNTHRMMCSNQASLSRIWPCITWTPPVLVDWLPWNHTFGGNFTFNMALTHGGRYVIDSGKPLAALIEQTVDNLREHSPTAYFNVPAGYEALLPHLESDAELAQKFFSRLQFLFTAAAALPQSARDRLEILSLKVVGRSVPILGGWGSTETAPCSTAVYFPNDVAANIGVPLPGTTVKLVRDQDKWELRVKGPNVMAGYWRQGLDAENPFDDEGFYKMGDAGRLVDDLAAERGILFDGRVSENFKLRSGTWVQVGALRLAIIDAARPLIQDVAIAGHDGDEVGLLIFPNVSACRELVGGELGGSSIATHPRLISSIADCLRAHNAKVHGASASISSFLIQATPPNPDAHEITDKGYLNQRAILTNRPAEVARLQGSNCHRL